MTATTLSMKRPAQPNQPRLVRHGDLPERKRVGPVDQLPAEEILVLLPTMPTWPVRAKDSGPRLRGARAILDWLLSHPGEGWQQRWQAAGADHDTSWVDRLTVDDPRTPVVRRNATIGGLNYLLLCRVVLPSYAFLASYNACLLFRHVQQVSSPSCSFA